MLWCCMCPTPPLRSCSSPAHTDLSCAIPNLLQCPLPSSQLPWFHLLPADPCVAVRSLALCLPSLGKHRPGEDSVMQSRGLEHRGCWAPPWFQSSLSGCWLQGKPALGHILKYLLPGYVSHCVKGAQLPNGELWVEGLSLLPISSSRQGAVSLPLCSAGSPVCTAFLVCETCTRDSSMSLACPSL